MSSALLTRAIRAQASAPAPVIDATALISERAQDAQAIALCRPLGLAVLAWCQTHTAEVGHHGALVENLRRALALSEMVHEHLVALWGAVPDTVDITAARSRR